MTGCTEIRELFSARADEALTADERARLDSHLATCAECTREWQRFAQTLALVRSIEAPRAPAGFVDRVMAARPRPWYRRLARAVFLPWPVKLPLEAAAILVVAGLAVLLVQRSPELQRAAREPATPPPAVTSRTPLAAPPPASGPAPVATQPPAAPFTPPPAAPTPPAVSAPPAAPSPADSAAAPPESRAASPPPATSSASGAAPGPPPEQELRKRAFDSLDADRRGDLRDAAPSKAAPARKLEVPSSAPPAAPGAAASGAVAPPRAAERAKPDALAEERSDNVTRPSAPPPAGPDGAGASATTPAPAPLTLSQRPAPHSNQVALANLANVQARLTTTDREAGERAVREIVTRVSGQVLARTEVDDGVLLSLSVPGPRWEEVKAQLQALGSLQLETAGAAGADPLRILLRLQR